MIGNNLLLDTNIVLGYLNGHSQATAYLDARPDAVLYVSVVTRMELLSFPAITPDEEQAVKEFLDCVTVLPLDEQTEQIAVQLRRATRRRLPDAIVAASAIRLDAELVTLDADLAATAFPDLRTVNPASA